MKEEFTNSCFNTAEQQLPSFFVQQLCESKLGSLKCPYDRVPLRNSNSVILQNLGCKSMPEGMNGLAFHMENFATIP